ncbi:hypothetical protein ILYODFUR_007947 [Ilyodon furcidens]|uniref:Uncharacterized protein n=1 Tax=Ilyodon furcidens TaxID=33524 RepID=A0ABV0VCH5_9TELE
MLQTSSRKEEQLEGSCLFMLQTKAVACTFLSVCLTGRTVISASLHKMLTGAKDKDSVRGFFPFRQQIPFGTSYHLLITKISCLISSVATTSVISCNNLHAKRSIFTVTEH